MSDMSQFCKRQPAACEVGGQAATVLGQRAADGARKVYGIITDKVEKADKPEKTDKPEPADKPHTPEKKKAPGDKSDNKKTPDHTGSISAGGRGRAGRDGGGAARHADIGRSRRGVASADAMSRISAQNRFHFRRF